MALQDSLFDRSDLPARTRLELHIQMRQDNTARALAGFKTETRRTNTSKYLKLDEGDWLLLPGLNVPMIVSRKPHTERLLSISPESAIAEGIICAGNGRYYPSMLAKACGRDGFTDPCQAFFALWNEFYPARHKNHSANNPLVAVVSFTTSLPIKRKLQNGNT